MAGGDDLPVLRISELSRRTGVPVPTIRGWERRHQFPAPSRTASGYRLYSESDVRRISQLRALIDEGMAVSQAVEVMQQRAAKTLPVEDVMPIDGGGSPALLTGRLVSALLAMDSSAAHALLDRAFGALGVESAMCDVSLAAVREIGDRWARDEASVAQEHFASNLVRGRLWGLTRGWDQGAGRQVLLAAAGGDQHDLPLLMLGILMREHGWRITWIGADTPALMLLDAAQSIQPELIVVSITRRRPAAAEIENLRQLAQAGPRLAIAGRAATARLASEIGATLLDGSPDQIARELG